MQPLIVKKGLRFTLNYNCTSQARLQQIGNFYKIDKFTYICYSKSSLKIAILTTDIFVFRMSLAGRHQVKLQQIATKQTRYYIKNAGY